jgi:hypothetical protein
VTTAVANRTVDMPQSQPLNSATTDQPPPASLKNDPYICPRTDTVEKLAAILEEKKVIHVRGTPSSGKTILAHLLWEYYRNQKERAILLEGWHNVTDPRIHLVNECKAHGYDEIEPHNLNNANIIFMLDEAQQSYSDGRLWTGIIKTTSGSHGGLRICLFSSYGSPTTGSTEYPSESTPPYLGVSQRISIAPSEFPDNRGVCLFYNKEEFEDVVRRRCSDPTNKFKLDSAARKYLYSITNGHPGATESLLAYISMVCMSCSIYWSMITNTAIDLPI